MIALSIIAAGIIAIAVALFLRPSFELRMADQRGITLQTLIVTAVLVLMAGAAGVVIIAITNNAQDNLEGQNPGVNSRCEPWEIFDPTLSAAGRGGGQGGIDSTAIGCIRVCYVEFGHVAPTGSTVTAKLADFLTEIVLADLTNTGDEPASTNTQGRLKFDRSDIYERSLDAAGVSTLPVSGRIQVDADGNGNGTDATTKKDIAKIKGATTLDNLEIRVANNQRYCEVWNNTTDQQEFRSEN